MRAFLTAIAVVLIFCLSALASGTPNDAGYYSYSGYWYWPTAQADGTTRWDAYTRYQEATYSSYGYRSYPSYRWIYYRAYDAPAYPSTPKTVVPVDVALPVPNDPAWMTKMSELAIFAKKASVAKELRKAEHNYFMEASDFYGLRGALTGQDGGLISVPAGPGSLLLGQHGHMGNTIYGSSQNTQIFGGEPLVNLNVGMQQSNQMVRNAMQMAGQGQTDFMDLLKQFGTIEADKHDRAMALVKSQAVYKLAMEALKAPPKTFIQSREFGFRNDPPSLPNGGPQQSIGISRLSREDFMSRIARPACGSCHNAQKSQGGFDIEDYPTFSMDAKAKIWNERLLTTDENKRMPRGPGNGPGPKLPDEVLRQFLMH